MSLSTSEMTPADFAAVTGGNNGFGDNSFWWIIVLFLFIFMGWGGNGFGGNNSGAADNYVLASDFATLERQIDSSTDRLAQQGNSIANGLCDGFYTQAQLINGVNTAINTNGYETRNAITQAQINEMQNANAIQSQLSSCCCQNREAIANLNYNMATQNCATNNAIATATRDINDTANANARAILDAITAQTIAQKDEKIAEQNQTIFGLQLAASQQAQNTYLISQLRPSPVPSFNVATPYQYASGCGCSYTS